MGSITTSGTLPIGVTIEGVTHRAYVLRGALVSDNIAATDELVARGEGPDHLRIATALMSRQVVSLGTLAPQQITTDLMRGLHIADWNHLDKASEVLEKKLLGVEQTPTPAGGSTFWPGVEETALTPTT